MNNYFLLNPLINNKNNYQIEKFDNITTPLDLKFFDDLNESKVKDIFNNIKNKVFYYDNDEKSINDNILFDNNTIKYNICYGLIKFENNGNYCLKIKHNNSHIKISFNNNIILDTFESNYILNNINYSLCYISNIINNTYYPISISRLNNTDINFKFELYISNTKTINNYIDLKNILYIHPLIKKNPENLNFENKLISLLNNSNTKYFNDSYFKEIYSYVSIYIDNKTDNETQICKIFDNDDDNNIYINSFNKNLITVKNISKELIGYYFYKNETDNEKPEYLINDKFNNTSDNYHETLANYTITYINIKNGDKFETSGESYSNYLPINKSIKPQFIINKIIYTYNKNNQKIDSKNENNIYILSNLQQKSNFIYKFDLNNTYANHSCGSPSFTIPYKSRILSVVYTARCPNDNIKLYLNYNCSSLCKTNYLTISHNHIDYFYTTHVSLINENLHEWGVNTSILDDNINGCILNKNEKLYFNLTTLNAPNYLTVNTTINNSYGDMCIIIYLEKIN